MVNSALFSSKSDDWATPADFFAVLNAEFNFDLDVCASEKNHKTPDYFDEKTDGLSQNWGGRRVFCNPPYSQIEKWIQKAWTESYKPQTLIVLLIPARTDTKYFHDYILHRSEIRFVKGRLKFGNSEHAAPFPSMVVVYRSGGLRDSGGQQSIFEYL